MSLKSMFKGWVGEVQGTIAKKIFMDAAIYTDINNVTIPTANGTTQIDHVIVSRYGIFVVETKNMDGWIFGDEKNPQWTQSLFGKKFKFQNPLHQNYRHTKALSDFLGIDHDKIFSVVMFWGDCKLKTAMPPNVMASVAISPTSRAKPTCCLTIRTYRRLSPPSRKACYPRPGPPAASMWPT